MNFSQIDQCLPQITYISETETNWEAEWFLPWKFGYLGGILASWGIFITFVHEKEEIVENLTFFSGNDLFLVLVIYDLHQKQNWYHSILDAHIPSMRSINVLLFKVSFLTDFNSLTSGYGHQIWNSYRFSDLRLSCIRLYKVIIGFCSLTFSYLKWPFDFHRIL